MSTYWDKRIDSARKNFVLCDELFTGDVVVVGLGALILNGLSYYPIEGNLTILSPSSSWDCVSSGLYEYEYLEGYDRVIGYEENSHIPTPERAICNCILYDRWGLYLVEALQFYMENEELYNLEKLLETANKLGISSEIILNELEEVKKYYGQ